MSIWWLVVYMINIFCLWFIIYVGLSSQLVLEDVRKYVNVSPYKFPKKKDNKKIKRLAIVH